MKILAYGEDALTLWALKYRLPAILQALGDSTPDMNCQAFFRPSFGRRGGEKSAQFGEFDFILLTDKCIYLGESKWQGSSERVAQGVLELRPEQLVRHTIFKFYVEEWVLGDYQTWSQFKEGAQAKQKAAGILKPIAPDNSLLATNLHAILKMIKQKYTTPPVIKNVLLFLHGGAMSKPMPEKAGQDFVVVPVDYSAGLVNGFIKL
jgi:hypothetical protein